MGASVGGGGGFVAEINVTPFVDVMLVLLIIFMVTAPMMTEGLEVDVPQTKMVDVLPTDSDHVILTVDKAGVLFLDEYRVAPEELEGLLRSNVVRMQRQLFLRADKGAAYGDVVGVMGRVRAAGIEKLGIVAERDPGLE